MRKMALKGERQLEDILCRAVGPQGVPVAMEAFGEAPSVSVRVNPSKVPDPAAFVREHFGGEPSPVPWSPFGCILSSRPVFTLDPLFHCGCYYVQDSSAMAVGHVFRKVLKEIDVRERPVRVLDLCAAPGGKTTDLASSLRLEYGDRFILVANEVMKGRASVLAGNVAIWGDPNVVVTSCDPKAFSVLEGFFDVIVADVPCSGEGMFRKDEEAVSNWSPDVVELCAARQKRIVADVWPALRRGGVMVYSTCTFEKAENDETVLWVARELGAEMLDTGLSGMEGVISTPLGSLLVPGFVKGEGQYVSALARKDGADGCIFNDAKQRKNSPGTATERMKGNMLVRIPESIVREVSALDALHPLMCGVALGTVKGKDLIPSADLALSLYFPEDTYPRVEVDLHTALSFLHRDTLVLPDAPAGYIAVCHECHPLGFVKNIGNRCNNLHPQQRRIRMNITNQ